MSPCIAFKNGERQVSAAMIYRNHTELFINTSPFCSESCPMSVRKAPWMGARHEKGHSRVKDSAASPSVEVHVVRKEITSCRLCGGEVILCPLQ